MFTRVLPIWPRLTARKRVIKAYLESRARKEGQLFKSKNFAAFTVKHCGYFLKYILSLLLFLLDPVPH